MAISAELYDFVVRVVEEKTQGVKLLRQDFSDLKAVVYELAQAQNELRITVHELAQAQKRTEVQVNELAEAQKRTEVQVNELAEAQKRTEVQVNELAEAQKRTEVQINELAQAQKRSEERLTRVETAIEELAQAQKRTEERLTRVEAAIEELSYAQKKTEEKVGRLATAVGALSDTVGFGIEDVARVVIPGYLFRHMGIDIKGELERRFFPINGKEVEINLYGEGLTKQGEKIKIFGECKSRIKKAEVNQFVRCLKKLKDVKGEILKVMCGFYIHPSATNIAKQENILLIASYQR